MGPTLSQDRLAVYECSFSSPDMTPTLSLPRPRFIGSDRHMLQLGKLLSLGQGCSAIPSSRPRPFLFLCSGHSRNGQDEIETHLVEPDGNPPSPVLLVQIYSKEVLLILSHDFS